MATRMTKWLFKNFNPIYLINLILTAVVWIVLWYASVNYEVTTLRANDSRQDQVIDSLPAFKQKLDDLNDNVIDVKKEVNDIHKYLLERK